jgi:hypothetical protein
VTDLLAYAQPAAGLHGAQIASVKIFPANL